MCRPVTVRGSASRSCELRKSVEGKGKKTWEELGVPRSSTTGQRSLFIKRIYLWVMVIHKTGNIKGVFL
jgi:hypothetical protein